ncbi:MAG: leucine--tRNA ligase [Candidatus Gracilibacteria bacterium]|nr:leucine--tRNA ligase [Candidatus Gracilibacteria bacterium]
MYIHKEIEKKWQNYWENNKTFKTENPPLTPPYQGVGQEQKPKYYCLDMFPFPSGAGLHVGHPEGMTANDIVARYKKTNGYNVLHPMGWDAFGLPAENYAIKTGIHPKITTLDNIDNFRRQIKSLGFSYDWDREVDTTDPKYYKWTQWIFLKLFEKGLAYEQDLPINYCPSCKTGLANEEVLNDFTHERCGTKVEKKQIRQWVLAITKYAERLLKDVDKLDWPEGIKDMQRNWIGKSEGCEFELKKSDDFDKYIRVYTTRVDTVFSMAFVVIAPDHPNVYDFITEDYYTECEAYIEKANSKSDQDRTQDDKEKTGVFTGSYLINPYNNEIVPLWIGDFVLGHYGTGAVFGDAHDKRDFLLAKKYHIPLKVSIIPANSNEELINNIKNFEECFTDYGVLINSGEFDGLTSTEAKTVLAEYAEKNGFGEKKVNYKLRDWLFSRQRYWGEPIPLVHCEKCGIVGEKEENLPILLPETNNFEPSGDGTSPLSKIDSFVNCKCPKCDGPAKRETNTMPQWGGSCWYYLRYMDPNNANELVNKDIANYWGEVDSYVGGAEHAVLHLLYARFWHKFLFDIGIVPTDEPFFRLRNQGLILAYSYQNPIGKLIANDLVEERDGEFYDIETGDKLEKVVAKMSKSLKNVVNPDDIVNEYGADSLRLYEMYMSEFKDSAPWDTSNIIGVRRFIEKSERLFTSEAKISIEDDNFTMKLLHKTIKKVQEDIENYKFNTAISSLMILVNNGIPKDSELQKEFKNTIVRLLHPFVPHLAEELWERITSPQPSPQGEGVSTKYQSVFFSEWPKYDEKMTIDDTVTIGVQVLGKLRGTIEINKDEEKNLVLEKAKNNSDVAKWIEGKEIIKEIYVPSKIVNIVIK